MRSRINCPCILPPAANGVCDWRRRESWPLPFVGDISDVDISVYTPFNRISCVPDYIAIALFVTVIN